LNESNGILKLTKTNYLDCNLQNLKINEMKNPKLGDYLLWEGKPAKIVGETSDRVVFVQILESNNCPHCNGLLPPEYFGMIPHSPLFQEKAEIMPTMDETNI
jgi:hypothetical protein